MKFDFNHLELRVSKVAADIVYEYFRGEYHALNSFRCWYVPIPSAQHDPITRSDLDDFLKQEDLDRGEILYTDSFHETNMYFVESAGDWIEAG